MKANKLCLCQSIFADNVIRIPAIYKRIFTICAPGTVVCVGKTCRAARASVLAYIAQAYQVERILSRFFNDPLEFRRLQARTFTLISGSSALQFFDRSFYPSSDLDLWVHQQHRNEVGNWLMNQGYVFIPDEGQACTFDMAVLEQEVEDEDGDIKVYTVFTFTKPNMKGEEDLKVEIVSATRTPMESILHFHFCECQQCGRD